MSLLENTYFLLPSAQLFPVDFLEPEKVKTDDPVLTLAQHAFSIYKTGQLAQAMEQYNSGIQQFPDQPFFYACRSILNEAMGDEEGAFYDYQVAKGLDFNYQAFLEWVENKPTDERNLEKYSGLRPLLADALESTQHFDYEHTLKLYAYANEEYPNEVDVLVYRGALYIRLLRYDKALADLNQALAMDAGHFQAYLLRAKLFKAVRENERAQIDFDKAAELQPKAAVVYEERGNFLAEQKLYDEALRDFDKLVVLLPEDFYVYALRADLFEKMTKWGSALQDYSKAIELNPYYSDLYAYRAEMKDRLGDTLGAAHDRRRFEELEQEEG